MYVDQTAAIVTLSIVFVCGSLSAFVAASFILRRYVSLKSFQSLEYELKLEQKRQLIIKQREELAIKTEVIQRIVYEANHKGIWPFCRTLRGMLDLIRMSCTDPRTREYIDKAVELVEKIEHEVMKSIKGIEKLQE